MRVESNTPFPVGKQYWNDYQEIEYINQSQETVEIKDEFDFVIDSTTTYYADILISGEIPVPDPLPQPIIAKLTPTEYYKLNKYISEIKGYDLTKDTQRYVDMNPPTDGEFVYMYMDTVTQELLGELITPYEKVESVPVLSDEEGNIIEPDRSVIDAEMLQAEDIDWVLNHYEKVGDKSIEVICLLDEPRTTESDQAVQKLIEEDITVITVE